MEYMNLFKIDVYETIRAELIPSGHTEITSYGVIFHVKDTEYEINITCDCFLSMGLEEGETFINEEEADELWKHLISYTGSYEV